MSNLSVGRNALALFCANIVARGVRLIYLLALARFLSSDSLALFVYGIAFYMLFSGLAGFGQGLFLAERRGRGSGNWVRYLQHSLSVRVAASGLVALGGVAYLLFHEGLHPDNIVLLVLFLALVPRSYALWLRLLLVANEDARRVPVFEAVARSTELIAGVTWLSMGGEVLGLAVLHLLTWGLEALWIHYHVKRQQVPLALGSGHRLIGAIVRWSLLPTASQWLRLAYLQIGVVALREQVPSADFVSYAIAIQFLSAGLILPGSLATAMRTSLSRDSRIGNGRLDRLSTAMSLMLISGGMIAVLVSVIGPAPFTLVLGSSYRQTADILLWLIWILGPLAAFWMVSDGLNQLGRRGAAMFSIAIACVIHGFLPFVLAEIVEIPVVLSVQLSLIAGTIAGFLVGLGYLLNDGVLTDKFAVYGSVGVLGLSFLVFEIVPLAHPFAALCAAIPLVFWIHYRCWKKRAGK